MDDAATNPDPLERARDTALPRPRTRWAGIIWGLVLGGLAASALWILLEPTRRAGVNEWVLSLSPLALTSYTILALGALALVGGLVGLMRRAQVRLGRDEPDAG